MLRVTMIAPILGNWFCIRGYICSIAVSGNEGERAIASPCNQRLGSMVWVRLNSSALLDPLDLSHFMFVKYC